MQAISALDLKLKILSTGWHTPITHSLLGNLRFPCQ